MFFAPKFLEYSNQIINAGDDFSQVRNQTEVQCVEVITFTFMLWIFRPRKEWPEYFSLGLGGLAREVARGGRPDLDLDQVIANMVPIFTSNIDTKFILG